MSERLSVSHGAGGIADLTKLAQRLTVNEGLESRAQSAFQRSCNWFSKAIWVVGTGQVSGISDELRSDLHFWRSDALGKVGRWEEAEADCSEVLALKAEAACSVLSKAQYRRAEARYSQAWCAKMKAMEAKEEAVMALLVEESITRAKAALQDIQQVLEGATPLKGIEETVGDAKKIKQNCEALSRGKVVRESGLKYKNELCLRLWPVD